MRYLLIFSMLFGSLYFNFPQKGQTSKYVYICTGDGAYSYHNNRSCSGLNRCGSEIKQVTLEYARGLKRTPCGKCYR